MTETNPGRQSGVSDIFLQPLRIDANHPAFAGHFPGRPIVPGVVLLDQVLIAIAPWLAALPGASSIPPHCEIVNTKFLSAVAPGELLQLQATRQAGEEEETIRFDLVGTTRKVASGIIKIHRQATP